MRKSFTLTACAASLLASVSLASESSSSSPASRGASEKKPIVAVFDVQAKRIGLDAKLIEVLSDHLATRLTESGAYQVVSRSDLKARLQKQKKASYKKCDDDVKGKKLGKCRTCQKSAVCSLMFGQDTFWYWSIQQGTPNAWGVNFKKGRINDDIEGHESYVAAYGRASSLP